MPLVKSVERPLNGFVDSQKSVLRLKEGPAKKEIMDRYRIHRRAAAIPSNGKSVFTIDDDVVDVRKPADLERLKWVAFQKRFTASDILLHFSAKEGLLYQQPDENYAIAFRQLDMQRRGAFCIPVFDSVQMEAFSRIFESEVVTSSLPYV